MNFRSPGLPRRLGLTACTCFALAPTFVHAFTADARRIGMGNASITGGRDLMGRNIAYQSMAPRPGNNRLVIPLPLGLIDLAADFPTLDTEDPEFSATRVANLAINPPFFLELSKPSELDGDISIYVSRNAFSIDFEDARDLLPQTPFEVGSVYAAPLIKLDVRGAHAFLAPVAYLEGRVAFDDAFYGVLAQGEALLPNSTYRTDAGGETMAGASLNFGFSRPVFADGEGNGLYFGANAKYIMGLAMGKADTQFSMATGDTIFGDSNPLDVGYQATARHSRIGSVGNGVGFDVGAAYRIEGIDVGVGLRDLGSTVHWGNTTLDRAYLDENRNEVVSETVERNARYTQKIPMQTTFNVSWSGGHTTLAADLTTSRLSSNLHFGAERRIGPLALRGGVLTDDNASTQYAWGFGVGLSKLWLDLGFQTHNRSFTRERGLTMATSIALR